MNNRSLSSSLEYTWSRIRYGGGVRKERITLIKLHISLQLDEITFKEHLLFDQNIVQIKLNLRRVITFLSLNLADVDLLIETTLLIIMLINTK